MMQQKERLEKQLDFIREIDKEKEIFRQTYLADASRKENDAEHAWHMAIMEQGEPLLELWEEFEAQQTPEAKFAHTMDNIQPMLLNDASGGLSWREHSVRLSQILGRNKRTALGSEKIWDYAFNNILKKNVENGNIIDDEGVFFTDSDK